MRLKRTVAAACAALLLAPVAQANHVDFLISGPFSQVGDGGGEVTGLDTADTLGGVRGYNILNGGVMNTASMVLADNPAPADDGPLVLASANGADVFTLAYGSFTSAGALNADFIDGPDPDSLPDWDQITVGFTAIAGTADLVIAVDEGGMISTFAAQNVSAANGLEYNFLHSELPGVDFSSVDGLRLTLTAAGDADVFNLLEIDRTAAIPEPTSIVLFGLGLIGLAGRRRK